MPEHLLWQKSHLDKNRVSITHAHPTPDVYTESIQKRIYQNVTPKSDILPNLSQDLPVTALASQTC